MIQLSRRRMLALSGGMLAMNATRAPAVGAEEGDPAPFRVGTFRQIYRPGPGEGVPAWHVNDHCFVRGPDDLWHLFGIAWTDPGEKPEPARGFLEHATSRVLTGPGWTRQAPVMELRERLGETVMWAPHVVPHEGTYYLFVCTGGPDLARWGISLATSGDLRTWERIGDGPLFRDGFQARDPMVVWMPEPRLWVMYYTATDDPEGGRHVVAYRTSADLIRWGERRVAYRDVHRGTDFGPTESPFVVRRGGMHYLFLGPRPYDPPSPDRPNFRHPGYAGTDVFASPDWRRWTDDQRVGHVKAHAPELVSTPGGDWYVSHCGIGQGGLFLAPFHWADGR
jgi:arabinan endo-1,5-alpha-L-arabinosidase